jgi:hypothetical protein
VPAFSRPNIKAYSNPALVILEVTAQAAGLSADEMEGYYTIPIEVGLAAPPDATTEEVRWLPNPWRMRSSMRF